MIDYYNQCKKEGKMYMKNNTGNKSGLKNDDFREKVSSDRNTAKMLREDKHQKDHGKTKVNTINTKPDKIYTTKEKGLNKGEKTSKRKIKEEKISLNIAIKQAIDDYNTAFSIMNDNGISLYIQREQSVDLIQNIQHLINSVANHPKSFDTAVNEIEMLRKSFREACDFAKEELNVARHSAEGVGVGIVTGAAVASVAPTAAIWVATTFGTASTGTAISALSGAVATKATLAWLGGGAIASGGGGVAAGRALLALAGPVGWGIGGTMMLASMVLFTTRKRKLNGQKKEEIESVKCNTETVRETAVKIQDIINKTVMLKEELRSLYWKCLSSFDKDFDNLPDEGKKSLGTLVNLTKALSMTLRLNV